MDGVLTPKILPLGTGLIDVLRFRNKSLIEEINTNAIQHQHPWISSYATDFHTL